MERISSRQNPLIGRFRELARGGAAPDVLLDGPHLLAEALDAGVAVEVAVFSEEILARLAPLAARAAAAGARTAVVSEQVLAAASPVRSPSGAVAIARRGPAPLDEALARPPQLVLLLGGLQDPGNVGAVIRAAEGCGATGVVAAPGTADPFGWKALRGAMGSTFRLPVAAGLAAADAVAALRRRRIRLLAGAPRDGALLPDLDLTGPTAILLGGEGAGLGPDLLDAADEHVTIPMRAPVESLNVAIAAALILYEASRQRARLAAAAARE